MSYTPRVIAHAFRTDGPEPWPEALDALAQAERGSCSVAKGGNETKLRRLKGAVTLTTAASLTPSTIGHSEPSDGDTLASSQSPKAYWFGYVRPNLLLAVTADGSERGSATR